MSHAQKLLHRQPASAGLTPYNRVFNGSSDFITCGIGAISGTFQYGTVASLVKLTSNGVWGATFQISDNQPIPCWGMEVMDNNKLMLGIDNSTFIESPSMTLTTSDNWCVIACTKASGSNPVIFYKVPVGGSLSTETSSASGPNNGTPSTGGKIIVGEFRDHTFGGDYWPGNQAIHAAWQSVILTSTQIASLAADYVNWYGNAAGHPTWQITLNQTSTGTSIPDDTGGGGGQTAITGTTVSSSGPALPNYGA